VTAPADQDVQPREDGLLEAFLAGVVTDEYASVPEHRDRGRGARHRWLLALVAGLIGLMLAAALANTLRSDAERQQTRDALLTRIAALSEGLSEDQAGLDEQKAAVASLQAELLESSTAALETERVGRLAELAATTPLAGPGLTVTIGDAPDAALGSLNRVLDRDLQDITNVLWQMGATGIAINDQRLTTTTAIRSAGDAILVNYQPLSAPYVVSAIGTATSGGDDSGLQVLLSSLSEDYGLVTETGIGDVALPAGAPRNPRFATTDDGVVEQ
jgi:uncharacterized protein YlxW (UPF0749 family)